MSRGAFLSNLFAAKYAKQPIADPVGYEKKLELTRKYFTPETEVLEIGCGTGSTAVLHAPYVRHIDAIDCSTKMIAIANGKLEGEAITNVTFSVEDVDCLASKTKRYDCVLGLNIIHLLEDKDASLKNIHALLKPGGYLITSTISDVALPWWGNVLIGFFKFVRLMPNIEIMSEQSLLDTINRAGFTTEEKWIQKVKSSQVAFIVSKKVE